MLCRHRAAENDHLQEDVVRDVTVRPRSAGEKILDPRRKSSVRLERMPVRRDDLSGGPEALHSERVVGGGKAFRVDLSDRGFQELRHVFLKMLLEALAPT